MFRKTEQMNVTFVNDLPMHKVQENNVCIQKSIVLLRPRINS